MNEKDRITIGKDKEVSLLGIFGIEALESLIGRLSDATDFSFSVIDYRGQNITEGIICNEYCRLHKDSRECMECQMNAAFAAAKAAIKCCPFLFTCPQGLVSVAVPIIVNEQYLGAVVGGRVRCDDELPDQAEFGRSMKDDYTEEDELYQKIPLFTRRKIEAIGDLMFLMLQEMGDKETYGLKLSSAEASEKQLKDMQQWNLALQSEMKEKELAQLKARLHPQFMLNMFTTISNFAVLEDAVKTQEIIVDSASIIRYYLDESRELVTMESEMEQLDKYLSILRSKYENIFNYHIQMQEGVKGAKFPVLTLFPLVGYVIDFGVFSNGFKGTLYVDADVSGDMCFVTIQMENQNRSGHARAEIPGTIMDERIVKEQIENNRKRLDYVFGDNYNLAMKEDLVTLRFPRITGN
ncbi:MAG: PocR ligand-binding domain-containing protein [Eubacterium sp.]|nr:PocR ligand-binding domain-containing protein [Eubacterium sp.]